MKEHEIKIQPAGYIALTEKFQLGVIPNWHQSFIADSNTPRINSVNGIIEEVYPNRYAPDDSVGGQLEFALKYDGTNLGILAGVFQFVQPQELEEYIRSKPKGKYTRRLWFFYEMLTGKKLNIDDLQTGGYVDALEPEEYYTNSKPQQIRRQRINDNLLGDVRFCPVIRKTEKLQSFEKSNLSEQCRKIIMAYSSQLLKRAMSYLYTKETKSSFEIEHVKPNSTRTERFIALLQSAGAEDYCNKNKLLELQNRVVDLRFQDTNYRNTQNYIGESIDWQRERVHYIPPRPEILTDLMDGLYAANKRMNSGNVSAVIHASAISFGFVFLHPFEDGNGRIHRFLLHHILLRREFTPSGVIFPLSASMLKNKDDYDTALESFSRPLMQLCSSRFKIRKAEHGSATTWSDCSRAKPTAHTGSGIVEYKIDNEGRLTVTNKNTTLTDCWYRYMDLTIQTETLFQFIEQTLASELSNELTFIANYDQAKQSIQNIVDMPDKLIDLFIHSCRQNKGCLSARKRASHFDFLTDDEIHNLESAISQAFSASSFSTELNTKI